MVEKPRKRIWVQQVAVGAEALDTRLHVAQARGLSPAAEAAAVGVAEFIKRARDAALRHDPIPGRWGNWWRGTLVEAAYRNLHAARAQMVDLYDEAELAAEVPSAVSRAQSTMHREDPRCIAASDLEALPVAKRRARLRALIEDGYEGLDQQHAQLRSFRNIVFMAALSITVLIGVTAWLVALHPTVMPLCFPHETASGVTQAGQLSCPTRASTDAPSGGDILIVGVLGLLGGALAASVSIRKLKGTATAYDVPVALAMLKVPLGAFTAILALVAIRGDFVPGFSRLDSQEQILAYALLFGFAQQLFTRLIDQRAESLLSGLPSRDASVRPEPATRPTVRPKNAAAPDAAAPEDPDAADVESADGAQPADEAETPQPETLANPEGDEDDQVQDDPSVDPLPDAPEQDHR